MPTPAIVWAWQMSCRRGRIEVAMRIAKGDGLSPTRKLLTGKSMPRKCRCQPSDVDLRSGSTVGRWLLVERLWTGQTSWE